MLGLLQFVEQYFLGSANSHGSQHVEALGQGALGLRRVVVHHLLKYLGIGLIALGHQANLVVAGIFELWPYACLLVAVQTLAQLVQLFFVVQQLLAAESSLADFVDDLYQRQIVGRPHQECNQTVNLVVDFHVLVIRVQGIGHLHCIFKLHRRIEAERHALQPHHGTEVALQFL